MKKILFAALAALAITSCTQNEEIEAPSQKSEVNFKTVVGKASRATPMLDAAFNNFKVYAYNTGATEQASVTQLGETTFMPGVKVEKKGDPQAWTVDGTYYWPATAKVQFFAYSPMESTALTNWTANGQYPSFSYTVEPVATQEDLIIAQAIDKDKTTNATTGVNLTFKHILTQINFSAKGETNNYTYTITAIKISGVNQTNTYTYAGLDNAPAGTWGAVPTDPVEEENAYVYDGDYTATINGTEIDLHKADGALLLLPQTLPNGAKITISYSVNDNNGNEIFNGNGTVDLKDAVWKAGSKINYTLTLSNNGVAVKFVPKVDDSSWNNEEEAKTPAV